MSGIRRISAGLFWGLCAVAVVALYSSAARQFARTIQHWIDGAAGGYAVVYASTYGL